MKESVRRRTQLSLRLVVVDKVGEIFRLIVCQDLVCQQSDLVLNSVLDQKDN